MQSVYARIAAAVLASTLVGAIPGATPAVAATSVINVVMNATTLTVSGPSTRPADRVTFAVSTTAKAGSSLEIFKLRRGHTIAELQKALADDFIKHDKTAVARIRAAANFFGGADVTPAHGMRVTETLRSGTYYLANANPLFVTGKFARLGTLRVHGTPPRRGGVHTDGVVTTTLKERFSAPSTLPRTGTLLVRNHGDTIHFMDLSPVPAGTTDAQVQASFDSILKGNPPPSPNPNDFSVGMGVLSPGNQALLRYSLPAGTYVLTCFVTDDETGLPHAFMGMHKVIRLR